MPGGMQPIAGQGIPSTPTMPYSPHAGAQVSTPSKIDPNQIPRPIAETSVVIFETRQGGQAAVPPVCVSVTSNMYVYFDNTVSIWFSLTMLVLYFYFI
jgi:protein transport protein SEC24